MSQRLTDEPHTPDRVHRRQAPPDYRSRVVRWRLFVLVAALMAVLVAMNEVRKPATWHWLGSRNSLPVSAVDDQQATNSKVGESSPAIVADHLDQTLALASLEPRDGVAELRRRTWQRVYASLSRDNKRELGRLLRAARWERLPTAEDIRAWSTLLSQLDLAWTGPLAKLSSSDQSAQAISAPGEREGSRVEELVQFWQQQDRAALAAPIERQEWKEADLRVLADLQAYVDDCDLAEVRDDMVWRPEERQAWFRILERLQQTDADQLARAAVGEVSYVQIFRQSREYRGKVVRVRGTAWLGYRVVAPRNDLDVQGYQVLWLRPADGSNSPIAVYVLEVPDGFPKLTANDQSPLREEVEITGYFFKRLLYRAHDGISVAPLVVARSIRWLPRPPQAEQPIDRLARRLGSWFWVVMAVGALVPAAGVTWLASWSSRRHVVIESALHGAVPIDWTSLPPTSSVEESLRRLSEREGRVH